LHQLVWRWWRKLLMVFLAYPKSFLLSSSIYCCSTLSIIYDKDEVNLYNACTTTKILVLAGVVLK
jgi:hypothetical protein